jgi:hypothetical protein
LSTVALADGAVVRARAAARRGASLVESLPATRVVAAFVVVEWLAVLATARVVRHAGWIYYQGGDQLWYYTLGWLLGHGQLTQTAVGYGWPAMLAPLARVAGPDLVSAFPAIVLFDVLVLLPIAMLALYGIAARIGGRLFGYWTLLLWVVLPFVGVLYTNVGYHQKYTELLLPQAFGLTGMADFPVTVATLVAVYFCVRALFDERPQLVHAVAAGVATGAAIAIKPSATIFLVGPALAFLYTRRFVATAAVVAGLTPAVVALAVWKQRGLGNLPLLSGHGAAPRGVAAAAPIAGLNLGHYLHSLDWSRFLSNLDLLREHFWSGRLIEWLVIAGVIALARRSVPAALVIGGWFFAFALVKGSYGQASIEDGSTFRIMMPSYPAFLLLIAALPLLFPHVPAKLRAWRPALPETPVRLRWGLVGAALLLSAILPLGAFAAASRSGGLDPTTLNATIMPVPANVDLGLTAVKRAGKVVLTWNPQRPFGGPVFYRVWRGSADTLTCPPSAGGRICKLTMPEAGTTHAATFTDFPSPGHWVYRVAVAANWLNDAQYGDPYLVSRPVSVTIP